MSTHPLRTKGILLPLIGFIGVAIYLFPVYWMLISGFKSPTEIFANPPTLFPRAPNLESFEFVFVHENILRYLRNSVIIAVPVMALTLILGAAGAYAMSRMRSRLVDVALVIVLLLQVSGSTDRDPDLRYLQDRGTSQHLSGCHPGDDLESAGFRACHPAADVPGSAERARGGILR